MLIKGLIFCTLACAATLVVFFLLPRPETVLSIEAHSETVAYTVQNNEASGLSVSNALLYRLPDDPFAQSETVTCVSGNLLPEPGAILRYRQGEIGNLSISFEQQAAAPAGQAIAESPVVARFSATDGAALALRRGDRIAIDAADTGCPGEIPTVLPIWGPAEIGQVRTFGSRMTPLPGHLYEGQVTIIARGAASILFFFPGTKGIYEAGTVTIPAGSQLIGRRKDAPQSDEISQPIWVGTALPGRDGLPGFTVNVSTEDDQIWLYRAGFGGADEPDQIGAATFSRQTNDPGVIRLQILIALLLIVIQTVLAVMQLTTSKE